MTTDYHAAYWAHCLSVKGEAGSLGALTRSLGKSRVDLNPHQVDAALFAVRSPFSKGALLADEVGLGKTIEAGIVLTQRWAERKRRILLIVPATLRKQWQAELAEKFGLPSEIVDGKMLREANGNPLERDDEVVIVSYNFAARYDELVQSVPWDLVVADEAHRLRNVYQTKSKQAKAIKLATSASPKLLLTATPLQNSLLELYGLVSVIDDHAFGDLTSFKEQFVKPEGLPQRFADLKERLAPYIVRTLRKQVLEYVRFTKRVPLTQGFLPTHEEQRLYDGVTTFLQREHLVSLPSAQRVLMTLVLRKLLASSTFAIAGTLRKLADRLDDLVQGLEEDFEAFNEVAEEWDVADDNAFPPPASDELLKEELDELEALAEQASSIERNAKGDALLDALPVAFEQAASLGAARKAVVFTESRRTQRYLFDLLSQNGYGGQIVCINGENNDLEATRIYRLWRERHSEGGRLKGNRAVDVKTALVEHFRDHATILLATESAAEGVNLQFCSLVVNYDLPWNPQRVEQRIGRCHRYGQKHDVIVVNFLNEGNAADRRVFELLDQKFRLFDGVFGASDEVLGALESGVDLEKRILRVYQEARTDEEIQVAFDRLQTELEDQIQARLEATRHALLDHFDQEVHRRLKVHHDRAQAALDERAKCLYRLTRRELNGAARFEDGRAAFEYADDGFAGGRYALDWRQADEEDAVFFHADHPLAAQLIERAARRQLPVARLELSLDRHPAPMAGLEGLRGRSGWLTCAVLRVSSRAEDEFLVLAGCLDDGAPLDIERCKLLMDVEHPVVAGPAAGPPPEVDRALESEIQKLLDHVDQRNAALYEEEATKLDRWADDLKLGLEVELKELDREIREASRQARAAVSLQEKLDAQKLVRALETRRTQKRRALYEAQDEVDRTRDALITEIENALMGEHEVERFFLVKWSLMPVEER